MLQTITTVLELVGFVLSTVGAWFKWGEATGLMVAGVACMVVGWLAARP